MSILIIPYNEQHMEFSAFCVYKVMKELLSIKTFITLKIQTVSDEKRSGLCMKFSLGV